MKKSFKQLQAEYNQNIKPDLMTENGVKLFSAWCDIYGKFISEFFELLFNRFGLDKDDEKVYNLLIDIKNFFINTDEIRFMRKTAICVYYAKKRGEI